jgi:alkylhydroperoxidase family enzyme
MTEGSWRMSRIPPAPREQYVPLFGEDASPTMQVFAHVPELAAAQIACNEAMGCKGGGNRLPFRLHELCRLRIAFHNQCRVCMHQRYTDSTGATLDEGMACSLLLPDLPADLSEAELAAVALADKFATDHLSVTDEDFRRLQKHFTDAEVLELCFSMAFNVGFGRLTAVLDIDPVLV